MSVSEVTRGFSSFWNDTIPFCDAVVTAINKHASPSFCKPLRSRAAAGRNALVNELGFDLFRRRLNCSPRGEDETISVVLDRVGRFVPGRAAPPSKSERQEARHIAAGLQAFFGREEGPVTTRLPLAGCGWVSACEVDALGRRTLYEVKSGDRGFLGVDIRQMLVYAALNSESKQYKIERVCLVNPRRDRYFDVDLEELCVRIAGRSRYDVLNRIVNLVSDDDLSGRVSQ